MALSSKVRRLSRQGGVWRGPTAYTGPVKGK